MDISALCLCVSVRVYATLYHYYSEFFFGKFDHIVFDHYQSIHMKYIQIIHDPWSISSSLSSIQGLVTLDKCELDAVPL